MAFCKFSPFPVLSTTFTWNGDLEKGEAIALVWESMLLYGMVGMISLPSLSTIAQRLRLSFTFQKPPLATTSAVSWSSISSAQRALDLSRKFCTFFMRSASSVGCSISSVYSAIINTS